MKRIARIFLAFLFFLPFYSHAGPYTVPAEWRIDQTGTWLGWPTFEPELGKSNIPQLMEMMTYITSGASGTDGSIVFLAVTDATQEKAARAAIASYNASRSKEQKKIIEANVKYSFMPRSDFWMRDYLVFAHNPEGKLAVMDFGFNAWGFGAVSNYFNSISSTDTNIPEQIAKFLGKPNVQPTAIPGLGSLVMEPGGLEFNDGGSKTLIVSEAVILQRERNPGRTKQQVHNELMSLFDLDKIIWLPKFKYVNGKEIALPQCPIPATNNPQDPCNNASSDYYTSPTSGGVVADDSPFYGPLPNPQSLEERAELGREDSYYDNVLTPLTTNGHTDEFVRWIGPESVLLAEVPNGAKEPVRSISNRTHQRLEIIKQVLINNGVPERNIYRIPTPKEKVHYLNSGSGTYDGVLDMKFSAGKAVVNGTTKDLAGTRILDLYPAKSDIPFLSARSYLNYVVTNKYIFIPKYEDGSDDAGAFKAIYNAFGTAKNSTGRTRIVVQINDVDRINAGGGGMHCISQNQPLAVD